MEKFNDWLKEHHTSKFLASTSTPAPTPISSGQPKGATDLSFWGRKAPEEGRFGFSQFRQFYIKERVLFWVDKDGKQKGSKDIHGKVSSDEITKISAKVYQVVIGGFVGRRPIVIKFDVEEKQKVKEMMTLLSTIATDAKKEQSAIDSHQGSGTRLATRGMTSAPNISKGIVGDATSVNATVGTVDSSIIDATMTGGSPQAASVLQYMISQRDTPSTHDRHTYPIYDAKNSYRTNSYEIEEKAAAAAASALQPPIPSVKETLKKLKTMKAAVFSLDTDRELAETLCPEDSSIQLKTLQDEKEDLRKKFSTFSDAITIALKEANEVKAKCIAQLEDQRIQLEDQRIQLEEQQVQLEEQQVQLEEQQVQLEEQQVQLEEQWAARAELATMKAEKAALETVMEAERESNLAALEAERESNLAALEAERESNLAALEAERESNLSKIKTKLATMKAMLIPCEAGSFADLQRNSDSSSVV
jgi:hypothetical protein